MHTEVPMGKVYYGCMRLEEEESCERCLLGEACLHHRISLNIVERFCRKACLTQHTHLRNEPQSAPLPFCKYFVELR